MLKKYAVTFGFLGLALFATSSLEGLQLSKATFQEKIVLDANGNKKRKMLPVTTVKRGSVLVYVDRIISKATEEKHNITIYNPIPLGTGYLKGTATCEGACKILFSIDGGKTYKNGEELYVIYGAKKRLAKGSEYTHIKYTFSTISPFTQTRMAFKALVK